MNTKKKIFIHVGAHKTGSSSIQKSLDRYKYFNLRHGVCYISMTSIFNKFTFLQEEDLGLIKFTRNYLDSQINQYKKINNFVISSENIFGDAKNSYSNLQLMVNSLGKIFRGYDVRIVIYIRRQDLFVESLYTHLVERGYSKNFNSFLTNLTPDAFEWDKCVNYFEKVFGNGNIIVKNFDEEINLPNGLIANFSNLIQVPEMPNVKNNASSNKLIVSIKRCLNSQAKMTNMENFYLARFLRRQKISNNAKVFHFNDEDRKKFLRKFDRSNLMIKKKYQIFFPKYQPLFNKEVGFYRCHELKNMIERFHIFNSKYYYLLFVFYKIKLMFDKYTLKILKFHDLFFKTLSHRRW